MPRKLKVYQARIGFYDLVVAAPSQAAALRAWGTHNNMFADGIAFLATDGKAIEAALAQPDVVLKRAVGTDDPFNLTPGLPRLPDEPGAPRKSNARLRLVASKPPPPDRSALTSAEAEARAIEAEADREQARFREREAALDAEEAAVRDRRAALADDHRAAADHRNAARSKAHRTLQRERQAFARAGGDPDRKP